jgi:hypothetical protein
VVWDSSIQRKEKNGILDLHQVVFFFSFSFLLMLNWGCSVEAQIWLIDSFSFRYTYELYHPVLYLSASAYSNSYSNTLTGYDQILETPNKTKNKNIRRKKKKEKEKELGRKKKR